MLTKFETIAIIYVMVISTILYFIPTLIGIKRKVKYSIKGKKISTKTILILQVLGLIVSGIVFVFLFPSKIMLFPVKFGLIIMLQCLILVFTSMLTIMRNTDDESFNNLQMCIALIMLLIVGITSGASLNVNRYIEYEPEIKILQYEIIDIDENKVVYWNSNEYEENEILISEEFEVKLTNQKEPYLEMITTTNRKKEKYAKDNNVIEIVTEKHIIYVPIPE